MLKAIRKRARGAFRRSIRITIVVGIGFVFFAVVQALRGRSFTFGIAISLGLTAVVFMTYFLLDLTGHRVSPDGDVNVSSRHAWWLVGVLTLLVMGAVFGAIAYFQLQY